MEVWERRRGRETHQSQYINCVIDMQNISKFESGTNVLLTLFRSSQTIFLKYQFHVGSHWLRTVSVTLITQVHFLLVVSITGHKVFELLISAYRVLNKNYALSCGLSLPPVIRIFFQELFWSIFIVQLMVGIVNWRMWQMRHHKI